MAATVIVEAREQSGALITADFALEDGREVFAVPGEITGALARGTNRLLRQGATPLTSAEDVLELYGLAAAARARAPAVGKQAAQVLARLSESAATADELVRVTGLEAGPPASDDSERWATSQAPRSTGTSPVVAARRRRRARRSMLTV